MKVELSKEQVFQLMNALRCTLDLRSGVRSTYTTEQYEVLSELSYKFQSMLAEMDGKLTDDDLTTVHQALTDAIIVTEEVIAKWSEPRIGMNTYEFVHSKKMLRTKYMALLNKLSK